MILNSGKFQILKEQKYFINYVLIKIILVVIHLMVDLRIFHHLLQRNQDVV